MTTTERMRLATEEARLLRSMTPEQFEQAMRIAGKRRHRAARQRNAGPPDARMRRSFDDQARRMRDEAEARYLEDNFARTV